MNYLEYDTAGWFWKSSGYGTVVRSLKAWSNLVGGQLARTARPIHWQGWVFARPQRTYRPINRACGQHLPAYNIAPHIACGLSEQTTEVNATKT